MSVHHEIPTSDDLRELTREHEYAATIYLPTVAMPTAKKENQLALKSAVDAIRGELRHDEVPNKVIEGFNEQWRSVDQDPDLWEHLSSSLAVFLTPESAETYVLPNKLKESRELGTRFNISPLLRSVTYPHEAYALTLSGTGWALWHATAGDRAQQIDKQGDHAEDPADANNKTSIRGRGYKQRLVGDEGKKTMLDRYALRVSDAVKSELNQLGVAADVPLFVFATEPLLSMFASYTNDIIKIPGGSDALKSEQIDATIREHLDEIYTQRVSAELDRIANDTSAGLVATELVDITRGAGAGMVDTFLFNVEESIPGSLDENTGEIITLDVDGEDDDEETPQPTNLLSQISVLVLDHGGRVLAIRDEEAGHSIWNHVAIAHLRHALN